MGHFSFVFWDEEREVTSPLLFPPVTRAAAFSCLKRAAEPPGK
jgi:hypothetical protein